MKSWIIARSRRSLSVLIVYSPRRHSRSPSVIYCPCAPSAFCGADFPCLVRLVRNRGFELIKRRAARIARSTAQVFFYAQELVVLGSPVSARKRTSLYLTRVSGHSQIGNERIFRFTRAVRDHCCASVGLGELNAVKGFSKSANLIHLDED